ncbi:MAG: bifunctional phosphopantothenoylcysteine decarboxylase/phosphopantothenate--cysteine ligase CoaBC [Raineya sp.]|jgi:phosphopantothenoylcysteine decarboxylase/phosphopantothenate--cysteine ligase|nr:bifunctional phosphopantothenoylcysteine decarboxylase/phosphopantothenate--cysteine ligase CoaBC [Raineya sp.]
MIQGKKIIVIVTASIAAYKSALFVRLLIKQGADVQVLMSESATEFITPLTLSTLSKKPVLIDFVKDKTGEWNNHVDLGLWADLIVFAPASANSIAKCVHGLCDNLISAVYLSAKCPVFFAPAMDLDMYKHPSTQSNLKQLQIYGNHIIPSEFGELASGLIGEGRMAEPEHIVEFIEKYFSSKNIFSGKKVLITAGATQEAIDPVRFISNHSTGKMGYAIAENFAQKGAEVTLVSGITSLPIPQNVKVVKAPSAQEMFEACHNIIEDIDICVFSAAVADYRPKEMAKEKIKKNSPEMVLELVKNVDIAATLGKNKKSNQTFVGFALETNNETENALKKLESKNFDMIILNSLQDAGAGFAHDTNKISIMTRAGKRIDFELKSKKDVADDIVQTILQEKFQ